MTSNIDIVCRGSRDMTAEETEATVKRLLPELLTDIQRELDRNGLADFDTTDCDVRTFTGPKCKEGIGLELTLWAPMSPTDAEQYASTESAVQHRLSLTPLRLPAKAIKIMVA